MQPTIDIDSLRNSVLKITNNGLTPDAASPWKPGTITKSYATVTCVNHKNKLFFVTNAHVVKNAKSLEVSTTDGSKLIPMQVEFIDYMNDLAVISPNNPQELIELLAEIKPLGLEPTYPKPNTDVYVIGFPVNAEFGSTKGVVTKTTTTSSVHSSDHQIVNIQYDAATNGGNSGGATIVYNKNNEPRIIAIHSASLTNRTNCALGVPSSIVLNFLNKYEMAILESNLKRVTSSPYTSFMYLPAKNQSLRQRYGISDQNYSDKKSDYGILVTKVPHFSSLSGQIKAEDIILEIDGKKIKSDGSFNSDILGHDINLTFLINNKQPGDNIKFLIRRKNATGQFENNEVSIKLTEELGYTGNIRGIMDDRGTPYYIHPSGVIFGVWTVKIDAAYTNKDNIPSSYREHRSAEYKQGELEEIVVVLNQVPGIDSIRGCHNYHNSGRVTHVEDKPIKNLWDLVTFSKKVNDSTKYTFSDNSILIVPSASSIPKSQLSDIKSTLGIRFFMSPNLGTRDEALAKKAINDLKGKISPSDTNLLPSELSPSKFGMSR